MWGTFLVEKKKGVCVWLGTLKGAHLKKKKKNNINWFII